MPVSNNWLNLRSFLRKTHNKEVNLWFSDVDNEVPGNSTARQQAKRACLILPKESQNMASIKMQIFRYVVQRSHQRPSIYGAPKIATDTLRRYKPQIFVYFLQDLEESDLDRSPYDGQISYRLMDYSSETITTAKLRSIGNRIKQEFGGEREFIWKKGRNMCSYTDWNKGYQLQLLVRNKTDGKELITKVLRTNSDTPDFTKMRYSEADNPAQAYPSTKGTINILGETEKEPIYRPVCNVRFQYGYCEIWGKKEPVVLYDKSFKYFDALVE